MTRYVRGAAVLSRDGEMDRQRKAGNKAGLSPPARPRGGCAEVLRSGERPPYLLGRYRRFWCSCYSPVRASSPAVN